MEPDSVFPAPDEFITSVAQFLIEGGEEDAASVIMACTLERIEVNGSWFDGPNTYYTVLLCLRGPRVAYDILKPYVEQYQKAEIHISKSIHEAINAVLPHQYVLRDLEVRATTVQIEPGWHNELLEQARGRSVANQAVSARRARIWNRLRFRSQTEIKIAEALDRVGVLFFPLSMARLSGPEGRVNREPDFLVCRSGHWGILEVDGEEFHPPSRATEDHERDRLFKGYGIRVVEHYDATDCFVTPDRVVEQFLQILDRAY